MIPFPVIVHMHLDGSMMIAEKDLEQIVLDYIMWEEQFIITRVLQELL